MDAAKRWANGEAQRRDTSECAGTRWTETTTDMPWTRECVTAQLILHNPYMGDGADISDRSNAHTEDMAIRWARHGITTVHDVLNATRRRNAHTRAIRQQLAAASC